MFSFSRLDGHKVTCEFDKLHQKFPFPKNYVLRFWFLIWTVCSCWVLAYYRPFCKIQFIKHSPILKWTGLTSLLWEHSSPLLLAWASWKQCYISTVDTAHSHFSTWLEGTKTILCGLLHWLCFRAWNPLNILARSWNIQAGISLLNQISPFAIRFGLCRPASTSPPGSSMWPWPRQKTGNTWVHSGCTLYSHFRTGQKNRLIHYLKFNIKFTVPKRHTWPAMHFT